MNIKLLNKNAKVPMYGSQHAAGADLYAVSFDTDHSLGVSEVTLREGECVKVHTGVALAIPPGIYGRIAPRSGLAAKFGVDVLAGVIDCDYRGEIIVILSKPVKGDVVLRSGDRIAQIIFENYIRCGDFTVVDELDETPRGSEGFGSTGVN